MRPLKLRIKGQYWDSYLYDDKLLLMRRDGILQIFSWDRLIDSMSGAAANYVEAFRHISTRGRAWYSRAVRDLIDSPEFRPSFIRAIDALSQRRMLLPIEAAHAIKTADVEVFPTTDLEIYANSLY